METPMNEHRSFAPGTDRASTPPFPMWPYAFTAYADHCSRDVIDYVDRLTQAEAALALIASEDNLGLSLLADMSEAFRAMVWGSFAATAAAVAAVDHAPSALT
jgi:hypothetical protein